MPYPSMERYGRRGLPDMTACAVVISSSTDRGMTVMFVLGSMPPFRRVASHLLWIGSSVQGSKEEQLAYHVYGIR